MSRLTFRNAVNDVAWQKQLRDNYTIEGAPPVSLDLKTAVIKPISKKTAEQVILKYEWLGTMVHSTYHFGIFFGIYCAGVTCVCASPGGANLNAHKEFGLERNQLAYLARGANVHWSPPGANSKLVSWTCRLLAKQTAAKVIIAYSDTDAGEIGTIYQACNWACVGRGSSTTQYIAPNGRIYDQKLSWDLSRQNGGTRKDWHNWLIANGYTLQKSNPKYRYVYLLDKSDKRLAGLIESKRAPYPKRNTPPVNGDDLATSQVGRFDPDPEALEATAVKP